MVFIFHVSTIKQSCTSHGIRLSTPQSSIWRGLEESNLCFYERVSLTTSSIDAQHQISSLTDFGTVLHYDWHHKKAKELAFVWAVLQVGDGCELMKTKDIWDGVESPWASYSDCKHKGIRKVCRLYNHAGCSWGAACRYSQAPKEKSVWDKL